jgi:PAS domain S-box-containing protein
MKKGQPGSEGPSDLRHRAEGVLGDQLIPLDQHPDEQVQRLLYELRVHQIELEMQNDELRRSQLELEASRSKYFDLFDLAPVGYLTVSENGVIREANLTAATLLGVERSRLITLPLSRFVAVNDQKAFHLHRRRVFASGIQQTCELRMVKADGTSFHARLETKAVQDGDDNRQCRMIVADITVQVQAEVALRYAHDELEMRVRERTTELEQANLALQAEIAERKQVETRLRASEELLEQRVEERTQELSTLLEISRNMALTLELEPMLGLILDKLRAVAKYDDATIFTLEGNELRALAHQGTVPPSEMKPQRFSLERAPFARELILNQQPVVIPDVRGDASLAQDFRRVAGERFEPLYGHVRSWMGVPLIIKDRVTGMLTLKHSEPGHYAPDQADLVLAFANQAALAIENTRLLEQAQKLAALEERQRLARDLHDAVSQTLFSASLAAEVLPRLWESAPDAGRRCLADLGQMTRGALAEMRTLLMELRPATLTEVELRELLAHLVGAASSRARLPVDVIVEGQCMLPGEVQVTLYRIAQEALSNIIKHAGATHAAVSLRCTPTAECADGDATSGQVDMCIEDNGRGFDPTGIPADRMGLRIMRERAAAIGAEIKIASDTGQGTRVGITWRSNQWRRIVAA